MSPNTIKGVWGFNGTERPGAVYLASVLATHAQKGLPAFGIYGHDVCEADDTSIPEDVKEKLLRFGRAAVACATMRGKSYLQIGSITMGIGGSIIDPAFIEEYLGMRVESVDEVEIIRRMTQGIYDEAEYQKALKWTREKCKEGFDKNPEQFRRTDEQKEQDWEFVVKMMCIIKDLMNGNKNLPAGCEEESVGHNAIAAGFQGQRQWTDFYPNCDFPEAMLNTSFDWNGAREPYILATENDVLNGLGMLFMKLLTNRAQIFADVRTYWSPEAVKKATGYELEGVAKQSGGFIHLINSGAACLDACGKASDENGNGVMKPWYDVTDKDIDNQISEKLMELLEGEIPEAMYDNQANEMVREFDMRLRSQGLDMKTYMQYMGMDANALKGMYKEEAEKRVKLRLALEAVARKENIEVTEADLDAEYGKMAEAYKMDVDKVKEAVPAESLTEDVKVEKALNLVKDKAVIK